MLLNEKKKLPSVGLMALQNKQWKNFGLNFALHEKCLHFNFNITSIRVGKFRAVFN